MNISNFHHPFFEELKNLRAEVPECLGEISLCSSENIENYDIEVDIILNALTFIDVGFGDSLLTDESNISDFMLSEKDINWLSFELNIPLSGDEKILEIAKKIRKP